MQVHVVLSLQRDRHALGAGVQIVDIGGRGDKSLALHQQRIDDFLRARRAQGVAAQGFGRPDRGQAIAFGKSFADRLELLNIAGRCARAVGIDVVDRPLHSGQGLAHAAHGPLARGRHHVVTVGGGAVTDHFRVDPRAPRPGHIQRFEHQHAATTGDDKSVAVRVIGPRGALGRVVVAAGERAHRVEQAAHAPVQFLAAAGKHAVLLAQLDLFHGMAYAVRAGRAGR